MDRLMFLTAAYAAVWLISFAYIFVLVKRNRALQQRLDQMEQTVSKLQQTHGSQARD